MAPQQPPPDIQSSTKLGLEAVPLVLKLREVLLVAIALVVLSLIKPEPDCSVRSADEPFVCKLMATPLTPVIVAEPELVPKVKLVPIKVLVL